MSDGTYKTQLNDGTEFDVEVLSGLLKRLRVEIGGAALAEIARVLAADPDGSEYALVTRPIAPAGGLPARASAADPVNAAGASLTLKSASINAAADGDNTLVAAVEGKKIRVIGYVLIGNAAGTFLWKSGAGTEKGRLRISADGAGAAYAGGLAAPAFETASGEALVGNNSAGLDVTGHLLYVEV